MKIYLVGGAVRDELLKLPIKDKDWVVVGATPDTMLQQGFQQVGRDFPVFLHPKSHEEYALARTERKSGKGYCGFITHFSSDVTLEQDLMRRDLTINAIARDNQGRYIDPYHGQQDIQRRLLRHVSEAFSDDPLRVLRVARFAARFAHLGFRIADETMLLMQQMSVHGELVTLPAERIWQETENALQTRHPDIYFQVLRHCQALTILFPEINNLFDAPTSTKWHPVMNTGMHTLMALAITAQLRQSVAIRFATLCHKVDKALTPSEQRLRRRRESREGLPLIAKMCQRLRVPNALRDLAMLSARYHDWVHNVQHHQATELITFFDHIDAWRKPYRVDQLALVSEADARGRSGCENHAYPQGDYLREAFQIASSVSAQAVVAEGFKGKAIKQALMLRRIAALEAEIHRLGVATLTSKPNQMNTK